MVLIFQGVGVCERPVKRRNQPGEWTWEVSRNGCGNNSRDQEESLLTLPCLITCLRDSDICCYQPGYVVCYLRSAYLKVLILFF